MTPTSPSGRLLKRELEARGLSANRLALDIGVLSSRATDILNAPRSTTADTAVHLGLYLDNPSAFWIGLQSQYTIARHGWEREVVGRNKYVRSTPRNLTFRRFPPVPLRASTSQVKASACSLVTGLAY